MQNPPFIMFAPVNNRSFSCTSGNVYLSSSQGVILNVVDQDDIVDLQIQGCILIQPRNNMGATNAPTVDDDFTHGYGKGSLWVQTPSTILAKVYVCTDMGTTAGQATWVLSNTTNTVPANILTPEDFGADPTGVADSTHAFEDLSAAVASGNVVECFSDATYTVWRDVTPSRPAAILMNFSGPLDGFIWNNNGAVINSYDAPSTTQSFITYVMQFTDSKNVQINGLEVNQITHTATPFLNTDAIRGAAGLVFGDGCFDCHATGLSVTGGYGGCIVNAAAPGGTARISVEGEVNDCWYGHTLQGGANQVDFNVTTNIVDRSLVLYGCQQVNAVVNSKRGSANDVILSATLFNSSNINIDYRVNAPDSAHADATSYATLFSGGNSIDISDVNINLVKDSDNTTTSEPILLVDKDPGSSGCQIKRVTFRFQVYNTPALNLGSAGPGMQIGVVGTSYATDLWSGFDIAGSYDAGVSTNPKFEVNGQAVPSTSFLYVHDITWAGTTNLSNTTQIRYARYSFNGAAAVV